MVNKGISWGLWKCSKMKVENLNLGLSVFRIWEVLTKNLINFNYGNEPLLI